MRFTKHMVLLGGVLALIAFFVPYGRAEVLGETFSVSALDLVRGYESTGGAKALFSQDVGGILLVFGPAVLLLLVGAIALKRDNLGRLGAIPPLLLGLWGAFMGRGLIDSLEEVAHQAPEANVHASAACYLLLAGGALGALAGLLALVKPDRG